MTLYFSAVWTQSGESGNTLKIKYSGTADERANIFSVPTTSEAECISQCSVSDIPPYAYTKQASAKTTEWSGSPRLWLTPPQKKKPRRYLRGNATNGSRSLSFKITSKGIMNGKSPYQAKVRHTKAKSPYTQDPSEESKKYIINYAFEREK